MSSDFQMNKHILYDDTEEILWIFYSFLAQEQEKQVEILNKFFVFEWHPNEDSENLEYHKLSTIAHCCMTNIPDSLPKEVWNRGIELRDVLSERLVQ